MKRRLKNIFKNIVRELSIVLRLLFSEKNGRNGKAIIVTGAPRSGSRMLTRFFISCGCDGNGGHNQLFDFQNPDKSSKNVVWRRHIGLENSIWGINLKRSIKLFKKLGYNTVIVWQIRNKESNIESLLKRNMAKNRKEAEKTINNSNKKIKNAIEETNVKKIKINYEQFINNQNTRKNLAKRLGLEYNEKEKYNNMKIRNI